MPQAVVDHLEAVQVQEQDGHLPVPAPGHVQGVGDAVLQQGAVGQAGEQVVVGDVLQLGLGAAALGDVQAQGKEVLHLSLAVAHGVAMPFHQQAFAIPGHHVALVLDGVAGAQHVLEHRVQGLLLVCGYAQVREGAVAHLPGRAVQGAQHGRVHHAHPVPGVDGHEEGRRGLDDGLGEIALAAQGGVGLAQGPGLLCHLAAQGAVVDAQAREQQGQETAQDQWPEPDVGRALDLPGQVRAQGLSPGHEA